MMCCEFESNERGMNLFFFKLHSGVLYGRYVVLVIEGVQR